MNIPAIVPESNDDARLLELVTDLNAALAAHQSATDAADDAPSGAEWEAAEALADLTHNAVMALRRQIDVVETNTIAGVLLKASVAASDFDCVRDMSAELDGMIAAGVTSNLISAFALARDLAAYAATVKGRAWRGGTGQQWPYPPSRV